MCVIYRIGGIRIDGVRNTTATTTVLVARQESPSSIETATSSSLLLPDSDHVLPEVPNEVVKQMESAYIDLDGGASSGPMDEDTTVDDSNSLSVGKSKGGASVVALRQDLLRDARMEEDGPVLGGDRDKVCFQSCMSLYI